MALPGNASTFNGPGHTPKGMLIQLPSGIYCYAQADSSGNLLVDVAAGSITVAGKTILTVCGSVNSNTSIGPAVTVKRLKVVFVSLRTSYSAGAIVPILTDGNGGTTIYQDLEQAISGSVSGSVASVSPPGWICGTSAGNALYLNPNGQTVYYDISYHADDAT